MTLDFIFALVLIIGFSAILFVISITMTTVSVVQYITFSASRNYFAAHTDPANQVQMATQKYQELISDPVIKPLLSNGWFEVLKEPNVGDLSRVEPALGAPKVNTFWGVGTSFTAKILDFNLPYFGKSDPDGTGDGSNFETYISSMLGREPTEKECWEFIANRWKAIRAISVSGGAAYSTGTSEDAYVPMEDSGC